MVFDNTLAKTMWRNAVGNSCVYCGHQDGEYILYDLDRDRFDIEGKPSGSFRDAEESDWDRAVDRLENFMVARGYSYEDSNFAYESLHEFFEEL